MNIIRISGYLEHIQANAILAIDITDLRFHVATKQQILNKRGELEITVKGDINIRGTEARQNKMPPPL